MTFFGLALDIALIALLAGGIFYAVRLTRQLADMRSSRAEMQRFILDFTATVGRAEAGIKGLKTAARSSGDDLEKLIERAHGLRDELHFLIESADQIANRLTAMGTFVARASSASEEEAKMSAKAAKPISAQAPASGSRAAQEKTGAFKEEEAASAAERDLLRVLSKLG